ncbi:hypothetical protein [Bradyrhizobium yuanmingense]|nr:hypothetical protein [Bradyrhizobium yuanmingense]
MPVLLLIIGVGGMPHLMIGMLIMRLPIPLIILPIAPIGIMLVVLAGTDLSQDRAKSDLRNEVREARVSQLHAMSLVEILL